jgi:hypothetical protein
MHLKTHASPHPPKVSDIARKIVNSRSTTVDRNNVAMGMGEGVEIMDGELKGKKGE